MGKQHEGLKNIRLALFIMKAIVLAKCRRKFVRRSMSRSWKACFRLLFRNQSHKFLSNKMLQKVHFASQIFFFQPDPLPNSAAQNRKTQQEVGRDHFQYRYNQNIAVLPERLPPEAMQKFVAIDLAKGHFKKKKLIALIASVNYCYFGYLKYSNDLQTKQLLSLFTSCVVVRFTIHYFSQHVFHFVQKSSWKLIVLIWIR